MTMERPELVDAQPRLRNAPMRPRAWRELLGSDDAAAIEGDAGALVLSMALGQLNLHYAFSEMEEMRVDFVPMFDELKSEIASFDADYVRIDLVQIPDRTWIEPLLSETDFIEFGEWMDMVHRELDAETPPPEFPEGVVMRRGNDDDAERIVEIEAAAYGDLADGETATLERLEAAAWVGVLERDGEIVAYAINGEVERAEGQVLSAAVDPDAWGNGFGQLVLGAATYQLAANDARRAVVRVRSAIPQALRTTQALGYSPGDRGIEWRRTADEEAIAERRAQARVTGVKARFGDWR